MQHHAVDERRALSETLRAAGPHAETKSGEWRTAQLAAHLVLRERSVVEAAGRLPVRALKRRAEHAVDDFAAQKSYAVLVDAVERGPVWTDVTWPVPVAWLWAVPAVREQANLLEYLVHHEDVRRAAPGWKPRTLSAAFVDAVWQRLNVASRLTLRSVPVGLVLHAPGRGEIRTRLARRGGRSVTVVGDPVELALFTFGRLDVAEVVYDGTPEDISTVRGADISI